MILKEKLHKEVEEWKTMYKKMDEKQREVGNSQNHEVEEVRLSYKKLLDELEYVSCKLGTFS